MTARGTLVRRGGACALIGALLCAIGAALDPHRAAVAYLVAYASVTSVVLGALAMVMISQLTAATWFVVLRRAAEAVVAALPALALLVLPLLLAIPVLYPWVRGVDAAAPELRRAVAEKRSYLNVPFFVVRTVVYWASWVALGELLRRASREQDRPPDKDAATHRLRALSAAGLAVFAITVSFAAIDWLMSLTPAWYSTVYGVYFYAGGQVGALALLAVLAWRERRGELAGVVNAGHIAALAKLLLTFVLFWVYIGYSQLVVVWSGNLPSEVAWYVPRLRGAWRPLGAVLLGGHFALPFLVLLLSDVRRSGRLLAALGVWLLLMHYLDSYWLIVPSAALARAPAWWLDAGALLLVGGAALACAGWRRGAAAALPEGDPALAAALQYAGD